MNSSKHIKSFTKIFENSSTIFSGYCNYYYVSITKEKGENKWYIQAIHPSGIYACDGYFNGTFEEAMDDLWDNIKFKE